ncbi:DUF3828 domain-containing protein [Rahnella sp. Lac-M11]|jgi:hypothetical protein|uniref:DUF3828 domain-containing protein n=1 Tax=Rahnella contaminans TaxID=2703882 RepID=A0A6M2B0Q1_9GAMM|nr:DUF3828 domain-containing protein [Rahnella contaminans]NGX85954.1 DUF3828 domain-containing protein [Rahnella contaminans]
MRSFILMIMLSLAGCATHQSAEQRVETFYRQHLNSLVKPDQDMNINSPLNDEYIAVDTRHRISEILAIPEQEIISSDYFTYTQDYAPEWIDKLSVTNIHDFMGGKLADVNIGIEEGKTLKLAVYLKKEDEEWKIYRVHNVSDDDEQNIFDDYAISSARHYADNN